MKCHVTFDKDVLFTFTPSFQFLKEFFLSLSFSMVKVRIDKNILKGGVICTAQFYSISEKVNPVLSSLAPKPKKARMMLDDVRPIRHLRIFCRNWRHKSSRFIESAGGQE